MICQSPLNLVISLPLPNLVILFLLSGPSLSMSSYAAAACALAGHLSCIQRPPTAHRAGHAKLGMDQSEAGGGHTKIKHGCDSWLRLTLTPS